MATTFTSEFIDDRQDLDTQNLAGRKGIERCTSSTILTGGVVADNDVIVMLEIPVDANITSIRHWSDDLGTTGDLNLGFYPGNIDPTTLLVADAVDEDALATAIDVNAAAVADSELRFEVANISTAADEAWRLAGLSTRPAYDTFFLCYTASEATTATGDISLIARYVI